MPSKPDCKVGSVDRRLDACGLNQFGMITFPTSESCSLRGLKSQEGPC